MKVAVIALAAIQAACPQAKFHTTTDGTQSAGNHIWVDRGELSQSSQPVQEFIIRHECGHVHRQWTEVGADTYAYKHMKVTREMVAEMCLLFNSEAETRNRCTNLRKLNESNR